MKNKFIVITGASTGIGQAIAIEFGEAGATTALIARRKSNLLQTKKLVEKAGGKGIILITDLSKIKEINQLISSIKSQTKTVNILINVAGIWHGQDEVFADKNFETFHQDIIIDTLNVGIMAPTLLSHSLIPLMPQGSQIVNISGTFENGAKGWLPYFVSKRAIEDLTIGLSEELADKSIYVNAISPSDTATKAYRKYFPQYINDTITPEEIARYIVRLTTTQTTGKVFIMKKRHKTT